MPTRFDNANSDNANGSGPNTAVVAWLSLVEEEGGSGFRAALFLTTDDGEPVGFRFTRTFPRWPGERGDGTGASVAAHVLEQLLQAASPPTLILGLQSEVPGDSMDAGDSRIPLCLLADDIGLADVDSERGANGQAGVLWQSQPPQVGSVARRLLDEVLEWDDPLEPFRRAADGLNVAFADEHVRGLMNARGLATVVSLDTPAGSRDHPATAVSLSERGNTAERPEGTLAQRLWAVLRAPLGSPRGVRLQWRGELMPFQADGVRALMANHRLLLADDMGLGKTIQAIVALRLLRAHRDITSALVVAPASVLDQWRQELQKWAPELTAIIIRGTAAERSWQWKAERDVTLVSYDALRSDFGSNAKSPVRQKDWDVVVADEAQRIKNRNLTSDALKGLRRVRSWALTGTPIENHEEELASIVEFVDHSGAEPPKRYQPGAELRGRHQELQLRRKKGDVLEDLPPKQVTTIPIQLDPKQRDSYDKAEKEGTVYLKSLGAEVNVRHVLELITRLKQICNADPKSGESSKLSDIRDRLEQLAAQGHKALVFSQYTSDTSGVAAAARYLRDFAPLTLTGDIPQEERSDIIDRFRTRPEHRALILSLRVGGLGLNLQEASYVFHLDRWWNPAVERQAEDRSHRMGQQMKVNAIKYSCVGTIEERIDRILASKQLIFDQLVDDVSLDLSSQMSSDELFGLFGLQRASSPRRR